jgi:hypothetical protein
VKDRFEQQAFVARVQRIGLKNGSLVKCPMKGCKQVKAEGQALASHLVLGHHLSRTRARKLAGFPQES